jgi:hypothetical protein
MSVHKPNVIASSKRAQRPSPFAYALVTVPTPGILAIASVMPWPHQPGYADYTHVDVAGHIIGGSLMVVTMFKAVSSLIPQAGPLPQILGVTKDLIAVINQMRDNKGACKHLVQRIISHMRNIITELTRMNVPLKAGSATAARLHILLS